MTETHAQFLPARRYASAGRPLLVVALCLCLSVCLKSVTSRCSIERDERIDLVLGTETFFRPVLNCVIDLKKFRYVAYTNIKVLLSKIFPRIRT